MSRDPVNMNTSGPSSKDAHFKQVGYLMALLKNTEKEISYGRSLLRVIVDS